jgi:hypothetical protein
MNNNNLKPELHAEPNDRLAREQALYRYSWAVSEGDFDTVEALWQAALADPLLEQMLLELEQAAQQEESLGTVKTAQAEYSSAALAIVRQTYNQRLLQDNSSEGKGVTVMQNKQELPSADELPSVGNDEVRETEKRASATRPRYGLMALAAVLVIGIIGGLAILIYALNQPKNEQASVAAAPTATVKGAETPKFDIAVYPGAVQLKIDEKVVWPNGKPPELKGQDFQAFAAPGDYKEVAAYYRKKLTEAGYKIISDAAQTCGPDGCDKTNFIRADKDKNMAIVAVYDPSAWAKINDTNFQRIADLVPSGQNLLITTYGPQPTVTTVSEPVALQSPTPVSASSQAYLGPDNLFHALSGNGLVSKASSAKVTTSDNEASFQLDWLLSDGNQIKLQAHMVGNDKSKQLRPTAVSSSQIFGILSDEQGREYELRLNYTNGQGNADYTILLTGPSLPATARKVTFKPGPAMAFGLNDPVQLELQTVQEAKLPIATSFPNLVSEVKGIKIRVPYAYFGPDRTVLMLGLDGSNWKTEDPKEVLNFFSPLSYQPSPGRSIGSGQTLVIVDDKGQALEPLNDNTMGGVVSGSATNARYPETTLLLKPVAAGVKSLSIKVGQLDTSLYLNVPIGGIYVNGSNEIQPTPTINNNQYSSLKVSLAELLKSGKEQPGGTLEAKGFKVQITGIKAELDNGQQSVNLTVKYLSGTSPNAQGAVAQSFNFVCWGCGQIQSSRGGATMIGPVKDGEQDTTPLPQEVTLTFKYDANITDVNLVVSDIRFTIPGPWQITLPVPDKR